jgi:chromosome segregation ATPase
MPRKPIWVLTLLLTMPAAFAQSDTSDVVVAKALLGEVRQLRQDLQATAAMIQRVQIAMYRLQTESVQLDQGKQRLEQARYQCAHTQHQQKSITARIQEAEARERDAANPDARKAAATSLVQLKSELEALAGQEQECQMEQIEAGNQVRDTQARVNELLDQLDRFDKLFAAYLGK